MGIPLSRLLVSVYSRNMMRINMQFVIDMIFTIDDNFSKNQQSALHAMHVMISMVTAAVESIETCDNGNIIMMKFMKRNTEKRIENPYIPMTIEAFRDAVEFMTSDNDS